MQLAQSKIKVNVGCPNRCEGWLCVDLNPKQAGVIRGEAVQYLRDTDRDSIDDLKAENIIEHLPNVGEFFFVANSALRANGLLWLVTDNAEFPPFYLPVIKRLGFSAHATDDYNPKIMNGTKHFALFTKLHLEHYAKYYGFQVLSIARDKRTAGARLKAVFRKL